jgi:hypothetical protein
MTDKIYNRRVRIVNDGGSGYATKVTDADTGELIDGVAKIELIIEASKDPVKAKLTILRPAIDIIADAEIREFDVSTLPARKGNA